MKRLILMAVALVVSASPAIAQNVSEREAQALAEQREAEREARESQMALREAEQKLADAAEEVARLSRRSGVFGQRFPDGNSFVFRTDRRPRLGLQLATEEIDGVRSGEGIQVSGVMPGSPAREAGIEVDDELLAIEGESLRGLSVGEAIERISEALEDREEGDSVSLLLSRDGKELNKTLTLNASGFPDLETNVRTFSFSSDSKGPGQIFIDGDVGLDGQHDGLFELLGDNDQSFWFVNNNSPWGDMELAELSAELGEYFGVDKGLLVVSAPEDNTLGFQDGDVIRSIGGREPTDIGHALRILRSYAAGETLEVEITRKRRKQTLSIDVPESRGTGRLRFERR